MDKINNIFEWLETNNSIAYSGIRVFLGGALFIRGFILFMNPDAMIALAGSDQFFMWFSFITISHLIGGLFVLTGLFTRIGAIIQIPVLAGAVFIVSNKSLVVGGQNLELASMVLFLLIVYFIFGGGKYALGNKMNLKNF